jgi:hypothetical protein
MPKQNRQLRTGVPVAARFFGDGSGWFGLSSVVLSLAAMSRNHNSSKSYAWIRVDHSCSTGVLYRARRDLLDLESHERLRRLRSMRQPERDTAKFSGRPGDGGEPTNGGCIAGRHPAEGGTRSRGYPSWRVVLVVIVALMVIVGRISSCTGR